MQFFLQNFSFSPTLTLNNLTNSLHYYNKPLAIEEPLIPTDHLMVMFNAQENPKIPSQNVTNPSAVSSANSFSKSNKVKGKIRYKIGVGVGTAPRKRLLTPPKLPGSY